VVPLRFGKPVWGTSGEDGELWKKVGELGKAQGLEWAGDWKKFKEFPHFQFTWGLTLADFQEGKTL
jgi:peptidoglycan L-alanyl-D-glutamate endopeptidase CwlK